MICQMCHENEVKGRGTVCRPCRIVAADTHAVDVDDVSIEHEHLSDTPAGRIQHLPREVEEALRGRR